MPNINAILSKLRRDINKAIQAFYTLNVIVEPDNPQATTEMPMYDDDGNKRMLIGKLGNDYGVWISRRNFEVSENLNTKYLSFTGSLLTPRIKYAGVVPVPLQNDFSPTNKWWGRNEFTTPGYLTFAKDFLDEKLNFIGFYKLNKADGSFDRVQANNPYLCTSYISVVQDEGFLELWLSLSLKTDPQYTSVDLEYFVFTDK